LGFWIEGLGSWIRTAPEDALGGVDRDWLTALAAWHGPIRWSRGEGEGAFSMLHCFAFLQLWYHSSSKVPHGGCRGGGGTRTV